MARRDILDDFDTQEVLDARAHIKELNKARWDRITAPINKPSKRPPDKIAAVKNFTNGK